LVTTDGGTSDERPFSRDTNDNVDKIKDEETLFERLEILLHRAILHILNILAPSLYTLSIYLDYSSGLFFPTPSRFPLLTDLSIKHPFKEGTFRSDAFITLQSCPRLRRVVLTGFDNFDDPLRLINKLKAFGPNITHLCVPFNAKDMTDVLQSLVEQMPTAPPPCSTKRSDSHPHGTRKSATFPQTIQRLFLHSIGCTGRAEIARILSKLVEHGTEMVILVEREWDKEMIQKGAVKASAAPILWERMWIDGIGGGDRGNGERHGDGYWRYPDGGWQEGELCSS
jgi:hypothetical protein